MLEPVLEPELEPVLEPRAGPWAGVLADWLAVPQAGLQAGELADWLAVPQAGLQAGELADLRLVSDWVAGRLVPQVGVLSGNVFLRCQMPGARGPVLPSPGSGALKKELFTLWAIWPKERG